MLLWKIWFSKEPRFKTWRNGKVHGIETACVLYASQSRQICRLMTNVHRSEYYKVCIHMKWCEETISVVKYQTVKYHLWSVGNDSCNVFCVIRKNMQIQYNASEQHWTPEPRLNLNPNLPRIVVAAFYMAIVMNIQIFYIWISFWMPVSSVQHTEGPLEDEDHLCLHLVHYASCIRRQRERAGVMSLQVRGWSLWIWCIIPCASVVSCNWVEL